MGTGSEPRQIRNPREKSPARCLSPFSTAPSFSTGSHRAKKGTGTVGNTNCHCRPNRRRSQSPFSRSPFSLSPFSLSPLLTLIGLMWLGLFSGCSPLDLSKGISWPGSQPKCQVPDRMTNMWEETILHQRGQRGVRGFGGRIMFFAEEQKEPVMVDGTFTVYVFDGSEAGAGKSRPERKFVFLPEDMPRHHSKTSLGDSYSFWIPWEEVGGPRRELNLIAQFQSTTGEFITAEESRQTLPGISPTADRDRDMSKTRLPVPSGAVRQVSHEEPLDRSAGRGMTTATITLPPSFARRMRAGVSPPSSSDEVAGALPERTFKAPSVPLTRPPLEHSSADPRASAPDRLQPSTRFSPRRFPARRELTVGPSYDPVRRQPHRAMWPSPLPATPRSARAGQWTTTTQVGRPAWN